MTVSGGAKLRLVDADSPQRNSGPSWPGHCGSGSGSETRASMTGLVLYLYGVGQDWRASAEEDDGTGFGLRTASTGGAEPAGNPAPEGSTRPRAGRTAKVTAMGTSARSVWPHVPQSVGPGRSESEMLAGSQDSANRDGRRTREMKPHEWQRPSRSQSGRGVNRRGGEKPRGRNVPGEASPGEADPVAHVVVGAPNSTRGIRELRFLDRR